MAGRRGSRPGKSPDALRYHDVMLALSEARAAVFVLDELASGIEWSAAEELEVAAWLNGWLLDVLRRCFDQAEAAFRKEHGTKTMTPSAQTTPKIGDGDDAWLRRQFDGLGGPQS